MNYAEITEVVNLAYCYYPLLNSFRHLLSSTTFLLHCPLLLALHT